jgi:glucokinase
MAGGASGAAGDPEALGAGLASAVNLLDPALVVLGGGVARQGAPWVAAVSKAMRRESLRETTQRVELARAGYDAGATGAARLLDEAAA